MERRRKAEQGRDRQGVWKMEDSNEKCDLPMDAPHPAAATNRGVRSASASAPEPRSREEQHRQGSRESGGQSGANSHF